MIFGWICINPEQVCDLETGDLLSIVRAVEDGQDWDKDVFSSVIEELDDRGLYCGWC